MPYNTLEGRYSSSGGRSESGMHDEEALSASAAMPAKRRLFSGPAALPGNALKTCEAFSKAQIKFFSILGFSVQELICHVPCFPCIENIPNILGYI